MLATCTDALLAVDGALELCKVRVGLDGAEKDGLVLVHARIGKEQGRVLVRYGGRGRDESVLVLLLKVGHEGRPDFGCWPVALAYARTVLEQRNTDRHKLASERTN